MLGINSETNAIFAVNFGDTGVVYTHNLIVLHGKARLGIDLEMNTVIRESKTHIGAFELLIFIIAVVVTEDHDVFAVFFFENTGIKGQRRLIRNILIGQYRVGVARDARLCFEHCFIKLFEYFWHTWKTS